MARVLVAEPDRQVRNFIAGILADFGHDVQQCDDARDVRRWIRQVQFDVLATDLVVDDQESGDCPNAVQHRPSVLSLSGRALHPAIGKYERPAGLHDKPFRFADLHFLVAAVGERETARRAA